MHYTRLLPLILINLLACATTQAATPNVLDGTEWELCGAPGDGHEQAARADEPAIGEGDQATYLSADQSEITQGDIFNFSGDVLVRRGGQRLEADKAIYDKPKDTIDAQGNVRYEQGGLALDANSAQLELGASKGEARDTHYRIAEKHARGDASKIILERPNHFRLKHARYTTCNPGSDAWYIHSTDVKLDHDKGVGSARHVWLEFKGVPFLYLPYMSFPLDDRRKSGFLTPSFGSSDAVGTEVITPYYWNIAPQRDATITPRMTSMRGMHLMGEYRYLYANGGGKIEAGYLPQDRVAHRDRAFFSLRHNGNITERWTSAVNFNYVSDPEYFKDLGNSLSVSSITHLERLAETTYTSDFWTATARLQGYQTVDKTLPGSSRPYQRLPQLLFSANLPDQAYGSDYLFNGEYVHFDRKDSLTAQRVDLLPGASLPLSNSYGYITPSVLLRHTQYALDGTTPDTPYDTSRTLPIASVDSGVTFERDTSWGSRQFIHTLEPRLFYLYVPYQNQADVPIFDTGRLDFSYSQMFQTNRFSGPDRVGDANQITAALSSRLLDSNGAERINAHIGQIFYFRDRRVTLPGETIDTRDASDILAEVTATDLIEHWSASVATQWDTQNNRIDKNTLSAHYRADSDHILNLAYRFNNDSLEQTDVAALWPLARTPSHQWNAIGRWNYSLTEGRTLEAVAGLEYDTCCWAVRLAGRRFVTDVAGATNNAIFVQFELKGLTSFGSKGQQGLETLLDPTANQRFFQFDRVGNAN